jgi:hypothetical protein
MQSLAGSGVVHANGIIPLGCGEFAAVAREDQPYQPSAQLDALPLLPGGRLKQI